ncbi:hypothetical protein TH63_17985 [Rufibacter radiotolerans]|uniref:Uncharacterized protein n=1 Tax=Rufibacter radiotolerans TaxID=1379910 RepID=A0A0H4VT58_9BACT|nr:hypothetical protein TH63_17985 [Rufibacter radiotolerans]
MEVMMGDGTTTVKSVWAEPPKVVTTSFPAPFAAPLGTLTVILVLLSKVYSEATWPFMEMLWKLSRFVPFTVTTVPIGPEVGSMELMVGAGIMVKSFALEVVSLLLTLTVILPVTAPEGTFTVILLSLTIVKVLLFKLGLKRTSVVLIKFEP